MKHMWQQSWMGPRTALDGASNFMGPVRVLRGPQDPTLTPLGSMRSGPGSSRGPFMGQTNDAEAWYGRAVKAVQEYEILKNRVAQIASRTEREQITAWLGSESVPTSPEYRYATVRQDATADVQAEGIGAYNLQRRRNRVVELENWNRDFKAKVDNAERVAGVLPAATTITRVVPGEVQKSDLTIPIVAAGAAVALAILLTQI